MKGDNKTYTLKDLLKNFAHDLINHCTSVTNRKTQISESGLDNLIDSYYTTYSKKSQKKIGLKGGDEKLWQ